MQIRNTLIAALVILAGTVLAACGQHSDDPVPVVNDPSLFSIATGTNITGYTQLAMNSKGDALVSWRQSNGSEEIVHAAYTTATGAFGNNSALSDNSSILQRTAVSENGDAFVVWEDDAGGIIGIGSNHYSPGAAWDGVVSVDTHTAGNVIEPWVATSPTGTAFAIWRQYGGGVNEVWASWRGPGPGWSTPELLTRVTGGFAADPTVAVDTAGNAVAAWVEFQNGYTVRAKRYQAGSGWDPSSTLIGAPADPFEPKIGMDKDGNTTVIWNYADNGNHGVQMNRYAVGSGWSGTETIIERADSVGFIFDPQLAVAADGTAVLAWEQSDGSKYDIWADHYTPGTGWTKYPVMVSDGTEDSQSPHVAISASGRALAAWRQIPSQNMSIRGAWYQADTGWGLPRRLSAAGDQGWPQYVNAAMDSSGNALIVWDAYYSDTQSVTIWGYRITTP